ncbi:MAG: leucine-rich repeat domain-containing protein [Clostridia bacterium]|nr:leucine-rich repeat domain-containing protein [Clostridia bacterium]
MKKRFLLVVVLFILAIGIVACDRKNENNNAQNGFDENIIENEDVNAVSNEDLREMAPTLESAFKVVDGTLTIFYDEIVEENKIVIPESVRGEVITKIAASAFKENENIEGIVIPNTVVEIDEQAFIDCKNLSEVILPENLVSIPRALFYGTAIETIDIPEGVKRIEENAFGNCNSLKEINIPASVEFIDDWSFLDTYNLEKINVDENNINFSSEKGVLFDKDKTLLKMYPANKKDDAYNVPDSVVEISASAFSNLRNLKNINLVAVEKIGNVAFLNSTSLEEVTFGNAYANPTEEIAYLFRGCTNLKKINVEEGNNVFDSVDGVLYSKDRTRLMYFPCNKGMNLFTIPTEVEKISSVAFLECENLEGVIIPDTVKIIGESAFEGCVNLKDVVIPDGVETIEKGAFIGVPRTSVKLPDGVKNVDEIFEEALQEEE